MWIYLGLLAALFLGLHNICKKHAVQGNEIFPVLLGTVLSGFIFVAFFYLLTLFNSNYAIENGYVFQHITLELHGFIIIKSMIMTGSWVLAYKALKHLPLTIVTPIRSAGPFFTFIGALFIYNEKPTIYQWVGFFIIILSVMLYSKIGQKEGINFKKNKYIFAIIAATFLGASSGLYDKYLIQNLNLNPQTLQFWFCFYTIIILVIILSFTWFPFPEKRKVFKFRWSIVLVGVLLQAADYFYFKSLQDPDALIMMLSAIKRSQLIIAVLIGGLIFKEKNKRKKLIPLTGILIGVFLILFSIK